MTLYVFLLLLLIFLILSLVRLCFLCWFHHCPAQLATAARHSPIQRLRHRHALHAIALPVASAAPSHWVWGLPQRLRLYAPGARSKADGERRSG
jgi:hypothetical protein